MECSFFREWRRRRTVLGEDVAFRDCRAVDGDLKPVPFGRDCERAVPDRAETRRAVYLLAEQRLEIADFASACPLLGRAVAKDFAQVAVREPGAEVSHLQVGQLGPSFVCWCEERKMGCRAEVVEDGGRQEGRQG